MTTTPVETPGQTPTWGRPASFTSEVADTNAGHVHYAFEKVGTLTLCLYGGFYPREADGTMLTVLFGRTTVTHARGQLREAPTLYGVSLGGGCTFDGRQLLARHLAGERPRLRVQRADGTRAPAGAEDRAGFLVGLAVQDYVARPDYAARLARFSRSQAPERAVCHRRHLAQIRDELDTWRAVLDLEQARLEVQEAWQGGGMVPALPTPPTHLHPNRLTQEGRALLGLTR